MRCERMKAEAMLYIYQSQATNDRPMGTDRQQPMATTLTSPALVHKSDESLRLCAIDVAEIESRGCVCAVSIPRRTYRMRSGVAVGSKSSRGAGALARAPGRCMPRAFPEYFAVFTRFGPCVSLSSANLVLLEQQFS